LGEHAQQSKKKCFKFSGAAPHRKDGSDTIPTRNKSKFKNEAEFLNKIVLYLNMFLIILNVQKDSLLYNWN
jgi:hypothetical protein